MESLETRRRGELLDREIFHAAAGDAGADRSVPADRQPHYIHRVDGELLAAAVRPLPAAQAAATTSCARLKTPTPHSCAYLARSACWRTLGARAAVEFRDPLLNTISGGLPPTEFDVAGESLTLADRA